MMPAQSEILAIIPARGGSQRIPGKNLVSFSGKPLIGWTIAAACAAKSVTRTVVSTDDDEIATVSREYGAEIVIRPSDISSATAPSEAALVHVLEHLHAIENYRPDIVVFLQATSPFRARGDIDGAVEKLIADDADSLLSVSYLPGAGFLWRTEGQTVMPVNYDPQNRPRTQDFTEEYFAENGSMYIFRRHVIEESGCRLGGRITTYHQPLEHAFEIDDPKDLKIMQILASHLIQENG